MIDVLLYKLQYLQILLVQFCCLYYVTYRQRLKKQDIKLFSFPKISAEKILQTPEP